MVVKKIRMNEEFKTYKDVVNAINKTYGKAGIDAYELCLKLYEEETGVNAQNLKGKLVFTRNSRGPVSAVSVANTKPAMYIKMIESGEISALKSLMKYYYNMVGDPTLNVNKLKQESLNKKVKTINERTEKGSLTNMLNTFNDKIDDLESNDFDEATDSRKHPYWMDDDVGFDIPDLDDRDIYGDEYNDSDDFDESMDVNEARQIHTWNVTYTGKGDKAKTHMVDAPDAYEANRKARRELGIDYSDIDDVTMVENKGNLEEDISSDYKDMVYDELQRVFDKFVEEMVSTVESDYENYSSMYKDEYSFEEWFKDTKNNYPEYFYYIFATTFKDYVDLF